jgi:hypothetical protein
MDAVQSFQVSEKVVGNPRDELRRYLSASRGVVSWWGVSYANSTHSSLELTIMLAPE